MDNTTIEKNIAKATELIQTQKEDISQRKNKILIAETRREENQKALEEDEKKVKDLGVEPEKIDETLNQLNDEMTGINNELKDVIEELENFDSI